MGDWERRQGEAAHQHVRLLPRTDIARRGERRSYTRQPTTREQDQHPLPQEPAPSEARRRSLWEPRRPR